MDELVPTLSLEASSGVAFKLKGLVLEGGVWNTDGVEPTTEMATKLGKVNFSWVKAGSLEMDGGIEVPIYLNEGRQILLTTVELPVNKGAGCSAESFYQKGIGLIASGSADPKGV